MVYQLTYEITGALDTFSFQVKEDADSPAAADRAARRRLRRNLGRGIRIKRKACRDQDHVARLERERQARLRRKMARIKARRKSQKKSG